MFIRIFDYVTEVLVVVDLTVPLSKKLVSVLMQPSCLFVAETT